MQWELTRHKEKWLCIKFSEVKKKTQKTPNVSILRARHKRFKLRIKKFN